RIANEVNMAKALKVLWLDDDTPPITKSVNGVDVTCVQTCADAKRHLKIAKGTLDCLLVDLVVPQAGWRDNEFLKMPGIQFMEEVAKEYPSSQMFVYSIAVTDAAALAARKAG